MTKMADLGDFIVVILVFALGEIHVTTNVVWLVRINWYTTKMTFDVKKLEKGMTQRILIKVECFYK